MKMRNNGFTLIELLLTITIAGILMAIAVPSMQNIITNNRLVTETNNLVTHISLARSEAIKRNKRVVLCHSSDPTADNPTCSGTSQDWSTGWITFVDDDKNDSFNGTELLLRVGNPPAGNITIKADTEGADFIGFLGDGTRNKSAAILKIMICADSDFSTGREIVIDSLGRSDLNKPPSLSASCAP